MNTVQRFKDLVCAMSSMHKDIKHREKECHFATSLDDAQNKHARLMHYPCVLMDYGDFTYRNVGAGIGKHRTVTLFFVDHCKDAGNSKLIDSIFDHMEQICDDFMTKIVELSRSSVSKYRFLGRFSLEGVEATRIVLESPALYGWAVILPTSDLLCPEERESPWMSLDEVKE